jgi:hypothetical protein
LRDRLRLERENTGVEGTLRTRPDWREAALLLLVFGPLLYLLLVYGAPIPQDSGYHVFADVRTCLGLANFGNVASNLLFLIIGAAGMLWCYRNAGMSARRSWMVFFVGVALVFFGSGYYHRAPNDDSLVWDRLPMTVAFMGLFTALLAEHLSEKIEGALLVTAVAIGIASVILWKYTDDLRVYIWVQFVPLLVIPFMIAVFPGRFTHRHYLLYGVGFYALAKVAEYYDYGTYSLTSGAISGHSLKHLLAAAAPFCIYLMLRRRRQSQSFTPVASSQ